MDKFTKRGKVIKTKKNEVLFEDDYLKIIKKDDWSFIEESDSVCVLPILVEENKVLLRMEVIPPFKDKDGKDFHLTCISGTIEEGEDPKNCLVRELEEEAGLVLKNSVEIEFFQVLYKSKTGSSSFHLCVLPLSLYSYDEVVAKGDGSKHEKLSKTVNVDVKNLSKLKPSDTVTYLLIQEAKKYLNIQ